MADGRRGHVLLVEDDPLILTATSFVLEDAGFAVSATANAASARHSLNGGVHFSAAVIDLGLPDSDGWSLVGEFRKAAPELPILVSSGRLILDYELDQAQRYNIFLLQKPYSYTELIQELKRIGRHVG